MENKSHALAAGAFLVVVLALLVAMVAWLARDSSEQRVFEISTHEAVTGLQVQAGVRYKGVAVGRVSAIALDSQAPGNVLIRIAVNDSAPITASTYASLGFQGVTGLAFVQLDDDAGAAASAALQSPRDRPARIPMRAGLMARLTEQGSDLLSQLAQASTRMNGLLAADNQARFLQSLASLGAAADSLRTLAQHADAIVAGAGGAHALSLPHMAAQIDASFQAMQASAEKMGQSADAVKASASEFRRMSQRMNEAGGTLDRVAHGAEALAGASQSFNAGLVPRLNRAADETTHTVHEVGRLADTLGDNPQSLITGRAAGVPGPGEPGFVAPQPSE